MSFRDISKLRSAVLIFLKAVEKESGENIEAYCQRRLGLDENTLQAMLETIAAHSDKPREEMKGH